MGLVKLAMDSHSRLVPFRSARDYLLLDVLEKMTEDWQPKWMDSRRRNNKRSKKQERSRAKEIGGRAQPGSGSSSRAPQDVRQNLVNGEGRLEQLKFTDKDRITIKAKTCLKELADAELHGREPGEVIEFSQYGIRLIINIERT